MDCTPAAVGALAFAGVGHLLRWAVDRWMELTTHSDPRFNDCCVLQLSSSSWQRTLTALHPSHRPASCGSSASCGWSGCCACGPGGWQRTARSRQPAWSWLGQAWCARLLEPCDSAAADFWTAPHTLSCAAGTQVPEPDGGRGRAGVFGGRPGHALLHAADHPGECGAGLCLFSPRGRVSEVGPQAAQVLPPRAQQQLQAMPSIGWHPPAPSAPTRWAPCQRADKCQPNKSPPTLETDAMVLQQRMRATTAVRAPPASKGSKESFDRDRDRRSLRLRFSERCERCLWVLARPIHVKEPL